MPLTKITRGALTADIIDSTKLADNAVDTEHIAADAVTSAKIDDLAVDTEHLAGDAVTNAKIEDNAVDTEHLADDAVGLAEMASGTAGNIVTYDASGNPAAVSTGSDGQVLTSAGSGQPAAMEAVPATDIATKANLASPTFTGNPVAPTQSASNNSTRIATTAYADTAVSNLVDSAPAALDTLNELAAALGDDASFSTTVTNSIAAKLPLAGGTMTGNIVMADDTSIGISDSDERIEFDGAGDISLLGCNVGIGTSSPAKTLDVSGDLRLGSASGSPVVSSVHSIFFQLDTDNDSTGQAFEIRNDGSAYNDGTLLMRVQENGNVGIGGIAAPNAKLHLADSSGTHAWGSEANPALQIGESSYYRFGIWTSSEGAYLHNKNGNHGIYLCTRGVQAMRIDDNQDILNGAGNATWHTGSDIKMKKDVEAVTDALDKVKNLRGVSFLWDENYRTNKPNGKREYGFIAQEVQEVIPDLVHVHREGHDENWISNLGDEEMEPNEELLGVDDRNGFEAIMIEAIKELSAKVDALENE